ncbi:MAG: hypothetical protein O3B87_05240 [bacterium]|nr:hypothetical protein [bacterium]
MKNIDWFEKFVNSDFMDELIVYRLREVMAMNDVAIAELKWRDDLEDFEKEDLKDCNSWAKSLKDVYEYLGGDLDVYI